MPAPATNPEWTVARILEWTTGHLKSHGSETPRLEAEVLLAFVRKCPRIQLYVQFNSVLTEAERTTMRDLVRRRGLAEPVAYLVRQREFFSLAFEVTPAVLIPRPETETLVLEALRLAKLLESPRIVDLGTGSGCIAVTLAKQLPGAQLTAIDISPPALEVAGRNAARHGVSSRVAFVEGDLFAPLAGAASFSSAERFDLVVSNPPYVATGEMASLPADIRQHEPALALEAGPDGLRVLQRIIDDSPAFLRPGGWLLLEFSPEQAAAIAERLAGRGYREIQVLKDAAGLKRCSVAQFPGGA